MVPEHEIQALRTATALADGSLVGVRVSGEGAFEAVDRVCPAELTLQDGQMRATLLLHEDGRPFADVYVCREEESFFLLAEGCTADELDGWLRRHGLGGKEAALERLDARYGALSLHGPFAWELLTAWLGPDAAGLPYLAFFRAGRSLCFRGGKTGEYGYDVFVPSGELAEARARLEDLGRGFGLVRVGQEALDQCALENGFFVMRLEGRAGLHPIELGLQWRLSYRKDYVGSEAVRAQRRAGAARRVTWLVASQELRPGDFVRFGERALGEILRAGFSGVRGDWVALAVLEAAYAHAGIDRFAATRGDLRVPVRTVAPPLLNNRSLYVSPQRHSYAERETLGFPPLT